MSHQRDSIQIKVCIFLESAAVVSSLGGGLISLLGLVSGSLSLGIQFLNLEALDRSSSGSLNDRSGFAAHEKPERINMEEREVS